MPERNACPTGKIEYRTRIEARDAMRKIASRRVGHKGAVRTEVEVHPCQQCGGWHLTSTRNGRPGRKKFR